MTYIDIVFDGPPSHNSGRFVEMEDHTGKSISPDWVPWVRRSDGYWVLRIPQPPSPVERTEHDRQVAERAWDAAIQHQWAHRPIGNRSPHNPYRAAEGEQK